MTHPTTRAGSFYDVLGIPPEASEADVKAAYRALAKRLHPDVSQVGAGVVVVVGAAVRH